MLKKGCIFIVIFLVISLSACSVPAVSTEPSETALTEPAATPPTESEASKSPAPNDVPQWPTYKIEADKAELNIRIPEGCRLEIKDARDGLLFGPPVWKTGLNCGKEYSRFHRVWVNGYGSN